MGDTTAAAKNCDLFGCIAYGKIAVAHYVGVQAGLAVLKLLAG